MNSRSAARVRRHTTGAHPETLSCLVAARPPVTDCGEAPPLLRGSPGVEPVAALLEVADDALAMLDGIGVVVLELGVHPQHRQPHAADAGKHPPVRRCVDADGSVAAFGLEVGKLGGENLRFVLRVVDNRWPTYELHRGVVTRRHAILVGPTRLGPPIRWD